MPPRPPVFLDGRSGKDRAPDVLGSGSEREPRLTPAARRRLRLGSVGIIVSIAAVAGGVQVQERHDAAAEKRRLTGLLQLSADEPWAIRLPVDPPYESVDIEMQALIHNDGPRDVTVTHASTGRFVLLAPVPLPAQTTRELVMHQKIQCRADAPPPAARAWPGTPGPLQITARTSRSTRTITLAQPPYDTEDAALACALLRNLPPQASRGPVTTDSP